jgi:serine/threonine protein kinase
LIEPLHMAFQHGHRGHRERSGQPPGELPACAIARLGTPTAHRAIGTARAPCSNVRHAIGNRIVADRYVVGEVLGAGGMGVVYRALDLESRRHVALKILHPSHADNPIATERFESEARAGRSVRHRNVVAVSDSGISRGGTPFLVMELVSGQLLDKIFEHDGGLPLRRVIVIGRQLLAGLQALHDAGFVHGDVKTGNVLVDSSPVGPVGLVGHDAVKLIDLGLARVPDTIEAARTRMASGTPEYMAPEVVRGDGTLPASDLYAAGVVLYQLLTGTTPFEGGTSREILRRHLDDDVVPPSLRCPERDIPGVVERIVMIALAKHPTERYPSAAAFATALAAAPIVEAPPLAGVDHAVSSTAARTREWAQVDVAAPRAILRGDSTERMCPRRDPALLAKLGTRATDLRAGASHANDAPVKQRAQRAR